MRVFGTNYLVYLWCPILALSWSQTTGCPAPSLPPDRRVYLSKISLKALVSEISEDTVQLWILQVYTGEDKLASYFGLSEDTVTVLNLRDRRLKISGIGNCSNLSTSKEKNKNKAYIVLLKEKHKNLVLDPGPGSVIPFTTNLENRILRLLGWENWSQWSSCSQSCGGGSQSRQRKCRRGICPGFDIERRVCNTFSCKGSINLLQVEKDSYFKPAKSIFHKIPGRQYGWSIKSGSYILYPFPAHDQFPRQFTLFLTFRPYKDSEGTLLSLTNPDNKAESLSLDLTNTQGKDEVGMKLVYSTMNGSRVVAVPAKPQLYTWNQLTISIGDESTIKTYLDCRWITTQILHGHQFLVSTTPDVAIGYMFQGDVEQLTVSPNPEDVSEQCSLSKLPLSSEQRNLQETEYLESKKKSLEGKGAKNGDAISQHSDYQSNEVANQQHSGFINVKSPHSGYPTNSVGSARTHYDSVASTNDNLAKTSQMKESSEDYLDEEFVMITKRGEKMNPSQPEQGNPPHLDSDGEEGSGDFSESSGEQDDDFEVDHNDGEFDLDWSSWTSCTATCGPATQTRWSRCADDERMMECIDSGMEKKVTRSCNLSSCPRKKTEETKQVEKFSKEKSVRQLKKQSLHKEVEEMTRGNSHHDSNKKSAIFLNRTRGADSYSAAIHHIHAAKDRTKHRENEGNICGCSQTGHCDITNNRCSCDPGWSGSDCSKPICEPPCNSGSECIKPNVCACKIGYRGKNCQRGQCKHGCKNGGTCIGKDKCVCPHGYSGHDCGDFTCSLRCKNGGICIHNNTCSCPRGFKGKLCQQRNCKEYEKVKVPRQWAYKTVANIHRNNQVKGTREQPVYRTFYRTTYKTVIRCKDKTA